ncbi:MAG: hydrogenase expression/formation protein HypE, partial [Sulfurovum sp.]|nr:hydrogenase expression/formation protein HypE [Sulfurovum sp.]NNJ45465.1 hydrogenase expression/formation protein HypE [Sulfurovum sp.]
VLEVKNRIAFTTDSFTVSPIFFNGGNIGKLAIAGTVNDLAMMGAKPLYLSSSFMIEEGFPFEDLETIVKSMSEELKHSGAKIVCGDTKVVPKGAVDKIFINTSGIGEIEKEGISANHLQEGDVIIVSGDVGRHGAAILMEREGLGISGDLRSDCATLWPAVQSLIDDNVTISAMRDATRGGLSAVLNEWAEQSAVCLEIEEASIPVDHAVQGICELFGFEAFDLANEGTCILAVPPEDAQIAIAALQKVEVTSKATIIGRVSMKKGGKVILHSAYGSSRYLDLPKGELLPRIC